MVLLFYTTKEVNMKQEKERLEQKDKERLEEIEGFFRTLEGKTEKYRKYFAALATLPQEPVKKRPFSQYGDSSVPRGLSCSRRECPIL
jgi:hypothetical protein